MHIPLNQRHDERCGIESCSANLDSMNGAGHVSERCRIFDNDGKEEEMLGKN